MPLVSVIVPAHNSEAYLRDTLRSVEDQTCADWEIVAVDDGSSDATWSLLTAAGPRVTALRNERAVGPAAARNLALTRARGEYVVFLDADDLLAPDYLESQLAVLHRARDAGRRVGVVTCDARLLDDGQYAEHTYLDLLADRDAPLTLDALLDRNTIYIGSLVPRTVGEEVGWFDEELFGTEDFGLWIKILERGYEAIRNPAVLAVYRRHTGSVSSNIGSQGANNRRVYELALARGRLTAHQTRIARRAIRYNHAMQTVAELRFGRGGRIRPRALIRALPTLLWVAATNPRWWRQWLAVLRTGRAPRARRPPGGAP